LLCRVHDLCSPNPLLVAQLDNIAHKVTCMMHERRSPSRTEGRDLQAHADACVYMYTRSNIHVPLRSTEDGGSSRQQASVPSEKYRHMTMILRLQVLVPWSAWFGLARALNSALAVFCFIAGHATVIIITSIPVLIM